MEILRNQLLHKIALLKLSSSKQIDWSKLLYDNNQFAYPFNNIEFLSIKLLEYKIISYEEYYAWREAYQQRNKYSYVFEITAPRTFGEQWGQQHLNLLVPELQKPSKKLDPQYSGEYDFWYAGIKIEVKASRAVKNISGGTLISKALTSTSADKFNMNFQQIKPGCCDVFVWIAVWLDRIRYWVLSAGEVKKNPLYSNHQHRNSTGEGQLWITESNISEFACYEVLPENILAGIIDKSKK